MTAPTQPTVRLAEDDEDGFIVFGSSFYEPGRYLEFLNVRREDLDGCVASDLEAVFNELSEPREAYVTEDDETQYDDVESPTMPIRFEMDGTLLRTRVEFRLPDWLDDDDLALRGLLEPLLNQHGLTLYSYDPVATTIGVLYLDHRDRDIDLGILLSAAEDVLALTDATRGGNLTMSSAANLVRAGHVAALIGQRESFWFDAKSAHYEFGSLLGKVSLGQAVTRFCNGEGGIIVIGLETSVQDGVETVSRVKPVALDHEAPGRYRKIIDQYVYPFPAGLTVSAAPEADGAGMVMLIEVPAQPDYDKPFLVSGAIVDGKSRGEFISVVQRRDDGSEPIKAATIHSWIVTGRALIQRGAVPSDSDSS
ncbi:hypothetical protein [Microbacterium sp. P04]|uniref:hypothetical protein n=1 Tax=Microbacterium sp. P04 TaxID=3366947 RepID=UPI0037475DE9